MVFAKAPQLANTFEQNKYLKKSIDGDLPNFSNFPKCSKRYCNVYHKTMITQVLSLALSLIYLLVSKKY
jgi:hypothetical protein